MKIEKYIDASLDNMTVKHILEKELNLSKRLIIKLKKNNQIYCNNIPVFINHIVSTGDLICVDLSFEEEENINIVSYNYPLDILYEDECFLIVNKPSNMSTHPSINNYDNTLSNAVKYYYLLNNLKLSIRPINRLDKNTSGIVIFAKNAYVQECLIKQMKNNIFKKKYFCLVEGLFENTSGTIDLPIARENDSIIKRCINEKGEKAITHYSLIKTFSKENIDYSFLKLELETGRTHQIRVHLSNIGYPILGDFLYGKESNLINRQALHCYKVSFIHPITNKNLEITCQLPQDMYKLII